MDCPSCTTPNRDARRFCRECGASLSTACPACGFVNEPGEKFCGGCGVRVDGGSLPPRPAGPDPAAPPVVTAPPSEAPATAPAAERRLLTVLFCDLAGSTELAATLDPEDLREIEGAYQRAVASAVEDNGGYVARYMGDGVLAYFGYPTASGDDAASACRAGLAAVDAVVALDASIGQRFGARLRARVGIATGLVVVGELIGEGEARERSVVGKTPNLAARLEGIAAPGSVAISSSTKRLVERSFELEDLGVHPLKGFADPVRAFRVVQETGRTVGFDPQAATTRFVGRKAELDGVSQAFERARAGSGQVVELCGVAGVGKSRLAARAVAQLADDADVTVVQCSASHRATPLHPFADHLPEENEDDADLPAETRRQRVLEGLARRLLGFDSLRPQVLLVEDVQDADPTSLDLLQRLVKEAAFTRALVLMTYRPELAPPWRDAPHVRRLVCSRLEGEEATALVSAAAGHPVPADVSDLILERADGVPLFVEEIVRTLVEDGVLALAGDRFTLEKPLRASTIPGTLHASLIARLDRLGGARRVAQLAAAIGRTFTRDVLLRVSGQPAAELDRGLEQLVHADVLERHAGRQARHSFKQGLMRDAAYDTLLRADRERLHQQIADALGDEAEAEVVADHLERAGRRAEAAAAYRAASGAARAQAAPGEAAAHLKKAAALLEELGDAEARLQVLLEAADLARLTGDLDEGNALLDEVEELTEDPEALCRAHHTRGNLAYANGQNDLCLAAHGRSLELARRLGARRLIAQALGGTGDALYGNGVLKEAEEHFRECVELAHAEGFVDIEAANAPMLGWIAYADTRFDEARELFEQSATLAQSTGSLRAAAIALAGSSCAARELMLLDEADLVAKRTEAIWRRLVSPHMLAGVFYYSARVALLRQDEAALDAVARSIRETLAAIPSAHRFSAVARTWLDLYDGDPDEAERHLPQGRGGPIIGWAYEELIDYTLRTQDYARALRIADRIESTLTEPTPWFDVMLESARAFAARAAGEPDGAARVQALLGKVDASGWKARAVILRRLDARS